MTIYVVYLIITIPFTSTTYFKCIISFCRLSCRCTTSHTITVKVNRCTCTCLNTSFNLPTIWPIKLGNKILTPKATKRIQIIAVPRTLKNILYHLGFHLLWIFISLLWNLMPPNKESAKLNIQLYDILYNKKIYPSLFVKG